MTARLLEGRPVARAVLDQVRDRVDALPAGVSPHLVFVTFGDDAETQVYLRRLTKQAAGVGVRVSEHSLPAAVTLESLGSTLSGLNTDAGVDGIVVQMPLPAHLPPRTVAPLLDPRKDVDGVTIENGGRLYLGLPGPVPSTAAAMMELLAAAGTDPGGKTAVIVGRSPVVGHPVAEMLLHRHAVITIAHSRTPDLRAVTRQAEILMVAIGRANMITGEMVRPGAVVIDAGINVVGDGIVGDVEFEGCAAVAGAITPVPGGVGPVTNAVMLRAVVESAERRPR